MYPALTTVRGAFRQALCAQPPVDLDVVWVGTTGGLEARIAAEEGLRFRALTTGKVRRTRSLRSLGLNLRDLLKVPLGVA